MYETPVTARNQGWPCIIFENHVLNGAHHPARPTLETAPLANAPGNGASTDGIKGGVSLLLRIIDPLQPGKTSRHSLRSPTSHYFLGSLILCNPKVRGEGTRDRLVSHYFLGSLILCNHRTGAAPADQQLPSHYFLGSLILCNTSAVGMVGARFMGVSLLLRTMGPLQQYRTHRDANGISRSHHFLGLRVLCNHDLGVVFAALGGPFHYFRGSLILCNYAVWKRDFRHASKSFITSEDH